MKPMLLALSLLVAAVLTVSAASVPAISLDELKSEIASNKVTTLDANGSASYQAGHIPGAIDYFANAKDLAAKLPADKNALIVAYCYNPECGAYGLATEAVTKLGYTNVKHFVPGISGWKAAGEPVQKDG